MVLVESDCLPTPTPPRPALRALRRGTLDEISGPPLLHSFYKYLICSMSSEVLSGAHLSRVPTHDVRL